MSLVTISASYGAGGSEIGPALAKRLGVPFVDRVISTEAAARFGSPLAGASRTSGHLMTHLVASLAPIGEAYGFTYGASQSDPWRAVNDRVEQAIFERADRGIGVILGLGAAVVLRNDRQALHVRLDGPREGRVQQAMRIQHVDRETAVRRMRETDRARYDYVRRFRRADARNPALYDIIIDSTVLDLEACVEVIALAAESHSAAAASPDSTGVGAVA